MYAHGNIGSIRKKYKNTATQLFTRKISMEITFTAKMNCWINLRVSRFDILSRLENGREVISVKMSHKSRFHCKPSKDFKRCNSVKIKRIV